MIADLLTKAVSRMLYVVLIKLLCEYAVSGIVSPTDMSAGARPGGAVTDQLGTSGTETETAVAGVPSDP